MLIFLITSFEIKFFGRKNFVESSNCSRLLESRKFWGTRAISLFLICRISKFFERKNFLENFVEILYDYEIFSPFFRFEFPIKICNDSECFYFPIEFLKSSSRSNRRNFEYLEFCFLRFKINPSSKFSTIRLETFFYFSPPSLESIARRNFQV